MKMTYNTLTELCNMLNDQAIKHILEDMLCKLLWRRLQLAQQEQRTPSIQALARKTQTIVLELLASEPDSHCNR